MGLILRYATAPTDIESGTVYDCGKLVFSPSTLLINITDQVYEYKYKREISQHNINPHQGNSRQLQPEDIELDKTIREIFVEYTPLFNANGITTDLIIPEKVMLKNTRRQFFRDILQNLIDNSIKAVKDAEQKIMQ